MKQVACYVRVSTVGQNEEGQKNEIARYCENHDLEPVWFVDRSTGDNLSRPAFEDLEKQLFNGEFDTVIIFKLDRLSRSLNDGIQVISKWLENGTRLIATSQQFDFSGAMGKMIASVLLGVAEMEQETRRERQAIGIANAKKKGVYKGRKKGTSKVDEKKVLSLLSKGLGHAEVAKAIGCSTKTVQRIKKMNA